MGWLWFGIIASIALVAYCAYVSAKERQAEQDFVYAAKRIKEGMTKADVIEILGHDYTFNRLKSGLEKYEWRYKKKRLFSSS